MNLKELYIISSILEQTLVKNELEGLKERLRTSDNYNIFLEKLLHVIIGKDTSITLLDFLTINGLAEKFIAIQNKKSDVIEELAELHFKSLSSGNTRFLFESNNEIFLNHLIFLKDTQDAFALKERIELKKKLQKLDDLNTFDLSDEDIKTAFNLYERQKLKERLLELKPKESENTKIISFNFKAVLKYAAIIVLVIGPAVFIVNRLSNSNKQELAKKEVKKVIDTLNRENVPYNFQLPEADSYAMEKELLQEQKFGFSSTDLKKIKITITNLNGQLTALENEIEKHKDDLKIKTYLIQKIDSIDAFKETYIFDIKKGLVIYSVKLSPTKKTVQQLKLVELDKDKLYLKEKNTYYLIKKDGLRHNFIKETSEDVIDQLNLIENKSN